MQVRFCCHDWTVFIVVCPCDFCTLARIRLVENNFSGITTWRDLLLGNTELGGIPELFLASWRHRMVLNVEFSPLLGLGRTPPKHIIPSQHDPSKERDHMGLFNLIRPNWNENTKNKGLLWQWRMTLYGYMSCSPLRSDYTTDWSVSSGHESHKNKKSHGIFSKENKGKIYLSCSGFVTELSSNYRLVLAPLGSSSRRSL